VYHGTPSGVKEGFKTCIIYNATKNLTHGMTRHLFETDITWEGE